MGYRSYQLTLEERYKQLESFKVLIGIPHNEEMIYKSFRLNMDLMKSFIGGEWLVKTDDTHYSVRTKWMIRYESRFHAVGIELGRNELVNLALAGDYDYLFMIDSDMDKFPIDIVYNMLDKMINNKINILGTLAYSRHATKKQNDQIGKFMPAIFIRDGDLYRNYEEVTAGKGIITGDFLTGTGCMMVNTDVFRKIGLPYFHYQLEYNDVGVTLERGEDVYFCHKAKEHGYDIHIDTDLLVGHKATVVLPYDYYYYPVDYILGKTNK